jgi:oligopeptidase B
MEKNVKPPVAPVRPHKVSLHGEEWDDPYFWLRNREDPQVRRYLDEENAYVEQCMEHTKELQEKLKQEMISRIDTTDETVPTLIDGECSLPLTFFFFSLPFFLFFPPFSWPIAYFQTPTDYLYYEREEEGKDHPIYCRKKKNSEVEEVRRQKEKKKEKLTFGANL